MYTRVIQENRPGPVENGMPLQGTWTQAFQEVDLLDIQRPFPFPLPRGLKDFRIKEWQAFTIQNERYYIKARFSNLKYFMDAFVLFYDKETGTRQLYQKTVPGKRWHLPKSLYNASVDSHSRGFFFRIHSWLDTKSIKLELNIKGSRGRPDFTAHAAFDLIEGRTIPLAVSLLFTGERNMYAFKALTAVSADVFTGGQHLHLEPALTSGLFSDFKGYYPYRMRSTWAEGTGFDGSMRRIGFSLGENQAREPFLNNENALWVDGALTPLPPVKITRSGSLDSDWIIQDMEGMVDLVFTPKELRRDMKDLVLARLDNENPLGYFNGQLLNAEGEEVPVKNIPGAIEKIYLRL